jgi:hypothetical protein
MERNPQRGVKFFDAAGTYEATRWSGYHRAGPKIPRPQLPIQAPNTLVAIRPGPAAAELAITDFKIVCRNVMLQL